MKYWSSAILFGLIACLGCGTFSHSRAARPPFVTPPAGRPIAPSVPDQSPEGTINPSDPAINGPSFDSTSSRKTNSTRISTFRVETETGKMNPPPAKGYIELPAPPESSR